MVGNLAFVIHNGDHVQPNTCGETNRAATILNVWPTGDTWCGQTVVCLRIVTTKMKDDAPLPSDKKGSKKQK